MSDSIIETTVEVLGKKFQIKCAQTQASSLQKASQYLDEKMRYFRAQGIAEFDKLAVIAALNVAHQLLVIESIKEKQMQDINQRIYDLHHKVEAALVAGEQGDFFKKQVV